MIKFEQKIRSMNDIENAIREQFTRIEFNLDKSLYCCFSEEFIREFQDYIDWRLVSIYSNLSEGFMREFEDRLWWDRIVKQKSQNLTSKFMREMNNEIEKILVVKNIMGGKWII